jgi:hypothetical protein
MSLAVAACKNIGKSQHCNLNPTNSSGCKHDPFLHGHPKLVLAMLL